MRGTARKAQYLPPDDLREMPSAVITLRDLNLTPRVTRHVATSFDIPNGEQNPR